jgi:hypothetical protein
MALLPSTLGKTRPLCSDGLERVLGPSNNDFSCRKQQ